MSAYPVQLMGGMKEDFELLQSKYVGSLLELCSSCAMYDYVGNNFHSISATNVQ